MGQARNRGSFEERKAAAIGAGKVKVKGYGSVKQRFHHPELGSVEKENEIMALMLTSLALGIRRWKP